MSDKIQEKVKKVEEDKQSRWFRQTNWLVRHRANITNPPLWVSLVWLSAAFLAKGNHHWEMFFRMLVTVLSILLLKFLLELLSAQEFRGRFYDCRQDMSDNVTVYGIISHWGFEVVMTAALIVAALVVGFVMFGLAMLLSLPTR